MEELTKKHRKNLRMMVFWTKQKIVDKADDFIDENVEKLKTKAFEK